MVHYNFDTEVAFNKFLLEFDSIKKKILKEVDLEIVRYNNLKESIISKNIDLLLDEDSLFNDAIKNSLKIIKYLSVNNVTDVPQYNDAIKELDNYIFVCDSKIDLLNIKTNRIESSSINNITIEDLKQFVSCSSLDDDDKLLTLLDVSYSKDHKEEKEEVLDVTEELEIFDVIESDYTIAKNIVDKYSYIINNQTTRTKMIRKSQFFWIDTLMKNEDIKAIDDYIKFEIVLYKLKELVDSNTNENLDKMIELFRKLCNKVNL